MSSERYRRWGVATVLLIGLAGAIAWYFSQKTDGPIPTPAAPAPVVTPPLPVAAPPLAPPPVVKKLPASAVSRLTPPRPKPVPIPVSPRVPPPVVSAPVPSSSAAPAEPEPQEWRGNDTAVTHPGQVVVKNDKQWIHFWSEHRPHEAAPEINFTKSMVIGVFSGSRPADAFQVSIVKVQEEAGKLVVNYREQLPPTGTLAVGVTVYPFHIKVIPRSTLSVKFILLAPAEAP